MTCIRAHAERAPGEPNETASRLDAKAREPVRLLLVDDDARVRVGIRELVSLEPDLVLVGEAATPAVALSVAAATEPEVALVDVLLPDEASGIRLVMQLCERPACVVVAMSVRGVLRHTAVAAGAIAFVEKGDDVEALLAAIRDAADRGRGRS